MGCRQSGHPLPGIGSLLLGAAGCSTPLSTLSLPPLAQAAAHALTCPPRTRALGHQGSRLPSKALNRPPRHATRQTRGGHATGDSMRERRDTSEAGAMPASGATKPPPAASGHCRSDARGQRPRRDASCAWQPRRRTLRSPLSGRIVRHSAV